MKGNTEMNKATVQMIYGFLKNELFPSRKQIDWTAKWMSETLRIGSMNACRNLIWDALAVLQADALKEGKIR